MADELIRRMALASCERRCKSKGYCMMDDDSNSGLNGHCAARAQSCLSAAKVDELVKALEAVDCAATVEFPADMLAQVRAALAAHRGGS